MKRRLRSVAVGLGLGSLLPPVFGWDYEGHRLVNQLALASLPADFPAFVHEPANAERIAFLAGEPDRWRNTPDLPAKHFNSLDHYLNLESLADAGIALEDLPPFRYEFAARFAAGRAAHPGKFPPSDTTRNADRTREWPGFAPWAIAEQYGRLKSAFSYLRTFEEGGTAAEIANARANVVQIMGVMGHYVGDCAQPLHTTTRHNGWTGDNPHGYTTWSGFHSWIDSGFIAKAGIGLAELQPRVTPARALPLATRMDGRDPLFVAVVDYIVAQNALVEPLYRLDKDGALGNEGEKAGQPRQGVAPVPGQGREFIAARLLTGGGMLGSIWVTAWKNAAPDTYLRAQLLRRPAAEKDRER